jgi:hypothetical protein
MEVQVMSTLVLVLLHIAPDEGSARAHLGVWLTNFLSIVSKSGCGSTKLTMKPNRLQSNRNIIFLKSGSLI